MKLAILGENRGPRHRQVVGEIMRSMDLQRLVILNRQGLARVACDMALRLGIPVVRFGHVRCTLIGGHRLTPEGRVQRGSRYFRGSLADSARHAARFGQPDLVVCIAPRRAATHRGGRRHHDEVVAVFKACGIPCFIGRFDKGRKFTWSAA